MLNYKHALRLIIITLVTATGCLAPVAAATKSADTKTTSTVQNVAQSYSTATPLQQGLIVQIDDKNKDNVVAANYKASKEMFGVVVAANDTPVSLSTDATQQKAYVVTSGRYNVLVSNQNGAIEAGDFVSISALNGIGMKADTTEESVLGRAVDSFDGKKNVISTTNLKSSDGKEVKAAIGNVSVDIVIAPNPLLSSGDSGVPAFAQKMAISLVGKPIGAPQLYISVAILLVGVGVVASLLYGGIQTGMIAIGRNPLAKQSIIRNLIQVIVTGLMIFIGCLIAVYLVLKI